MPRRRGTPGVWTSIAFLLSAATAPLFPADVRGEWWDEDRHFRAPYRTTVREAGKVSVTVNLSRLLARLGLYREAFDLNSIRVVEHSADGRPLPCHFEKSPLYSATHHARGTVTWRVPEKTAPGQRLFHVYFDLESNGPKPALPMPHDPPTPNLVLNPSFEQPPKSRPPWHEERLCLNRKERQERKERP